MADKVHPRYSTATDEENPDPNLNHSSTSLEIETPMSSASRPMLEKPPSPAGTYIVLIPKDQIYRIPSPRVATRYQNYNRKPRRCGGCCFRCFFCLFSFLFILIILLGIVVLVFYLVAKPKAPSYSVDSLSIKGFNATDMWMRKSLSPEFDVKVSANNPNTKIIIYYESGSFITIYHSNVEFSNGTLPVFYQPTQNLTAFVVTMKGTVPLTTALSSNLQSQQSSGKISLVLYINVPTKLKIGALTTWEFKVKVKCDEFLKPNRTKRGEKGILDN